MNPSGFYDASSGGVRPLPGGKFEVLEVDCWTRTPILANIGTFAVPLSTLGMIETHIEGVYITSSDKGAVLWVGYI